jgi:hypothetical protein
VDQEGFVKALRAKIRHRIEDGYLDMSRPDIVQIGRKVQMSPDEAADYFMNGSGSSMVSGHSNYARALGLRELPGVP